MSARKTSSFKISKGASGKTSAVGRAYKFVCCRCISVPNVFAVSRTHELAFIISNAISSTLFAEHVSVIYFNFFVTNCNSQYKIKFID